MSERNESLLNESGLVYHISEKGLWEASVRAGQYNPESILQEGFIHCSTREQVEQVANFFYSGRKGLILLEIDTAKVESEIKWEGDGSQKFPHIYGPLAVHSVIRAIDWEPNGDGVFVFPFERLIH